MGVEYKITHIINNNKDKTKEEIKEIITKKLIKVILTLENSENVTLNDL